jgi:hypothetical protein
VSGGFTASGMLVSEENSGDLPATVVGFDGSLRAGPGTDSSLPAFAAGVQTSLWTLLLVSRLDSPLDVFRVGTADLYLTGPRSDKLTSAIGGTVGLYHFMPYVQLGSKSPVDGGWYTTQDGEPASARNTFLDRGRHWQKRGCNMVSLHACRRYGVLPRRRTSEIALWRKLRPT